jgi:hypothetical protein
MAKGKVLTSSDLPKTGAVEGPTSETPKAPRGSARADGMVRLQQVVPGTVCFGGTARKGENGRRSSHSPAYRWSGMGVQTVPIEVARQVIMKFRNRFRSLDPM